MASHSSRASTDWRPTASWATLRRRAELLAELRGFFAERGFLEVETPLASADTVVDRHLDPLGLTLPDDPRRPDVGQRLWLQTSPEFAMKRLVAAGAGPIYQVAKAFRAAERGRWHNPEFTLVEWYRPGDDLAAGVSLLSELGERLLGRGPAEMLTYADAFRRHANVDPLAAPVAELADALRCAGQSWPDGLPVDEPHRDAWLDLVLDALVAPRLGLTRPAIVTHYPASQAALARVATDDPRVAERFELFAAGLELANGYHELLDADVLSERIARANAARQADGKPTLPVESRLLGAMRTGLPACAGCALGFDRLVAVAVGASSLDEVLAFPIERA
ncbi:MAG: EF-P lysine aminoacylase GenX [Pirellulales bacterium]|nr:EF-P lysine aminoacylase GenX [Pirellulales bacterium]